VLAGPLPATPLSPSLMSKLNGAPPLRKLALQGNTLVGTLPSVLGRLSSLTLLDLGYNKLSGPLPDSLCPLSGAVIDIKKMPSMTCYQSRCWDKTTIRATGSAFGYCAPTGQPTSQPTARPSVHPPTVKPTYAVASVAVTQTVSGMKVTDLAAFGRAYVAAAASVFVGLNVRLLSVKANPSRRLALRSAATATAATAAVARFFPVPAAGAAKKSVAAAAVNASYISSATVAYTVSSVSTFTNGSFLLVRDHMSFSSTALPHPGTAHAS